MWYTYVIPDPPVLSSNRNKTLKIIIYESPECAVLIPHTDRPMLLQVYQLQSELQKAQTENEYQKKCSLRYASSPNAPQLQEEVRSLRCQLEKAEKLDPVWITNIVYVCHIVS